MITANEARIASQQNKEALKKEEQRINNSKIKYGNLFKTVDERIDAAIKIGEFKTSLNSLDYGGYIVKTGGFFLSVEAFKALNLIYGKAGYAFLTDGDIRFICWK